MVPCTEDRCIYWVRIDLHLTDTKVSICFIFSQDCYRKHRIGEKIFIHEGGGGEFIVGSDARP